MVLVGFPLADKGTCDGITGVVFRFSISTNSSVVTKPTISAIRANSRRQFSVSSTVMFKEIQVILISSCGMSTYLPKEKQKDQKRSDYRAQKTWCFFTVPDGFQPGSGGSIRSRRFFG